MGSEKYQRRTEREGEGEGEAANEREIDGESGWPRTLLRGPLRQRLALDALVAGLVASRTSEANSIRISNGHRRSVSTPGLWRLDESRSNFELSALTAKATWRDAPQSETLKRVIRVLHPPTCIFYHTTTTYSNNFKPRRADSAGTGGC
jgi:hypothetical protein